MMKTRAISRWLLNLRPFRCTIPQLESYFQSSVQKGVGAMQSKQEILDIIGQASGTTAYHRFSPFPGFPVITDGVLAVAEAAGCFWLLDMIGGSSLLNPKLDKAFQVWTITVNRPRDDAIVRGYNDTTLIVTQEVPCTDFPLDEFKLYLIDGVILLPSEY